MKKIKKKVRFSVDISSTILYIVIAVDEQQHIAGMAQEVERLIGNEEVTSSTLVASLKGNPIWISFFYILDGYYLKLQGKL